METKFLFAINNPACECVSIVWEINCLHSYALRNMAADSW